MVQLLRITPFQHRGDYEPVSLSRDRAFRDEPFEDGSDNLRIRATDLSR